MKSQHAKHARYSLSSCLGWLWPWRGEAPWPYWPAGCEPAHWACSAVLDPLACLPAVTLINPCQNGCTWPHGRYGSVTSHKDLSLSLSLFYKASSPAHVVCWLWMTDCKGWGSSYSLFEGTGGSEEEHNTSQGSLSWGCYSTQIWCRVSLLITTCTAPLPSLAQRRPDSY